MKLLIDTNVILDILMRRDPFFSNSYQAIRSAIEANTACYLSASAATDIFYVLRKHLKSPAEAKSRLHDLSQLVQFTDVQPMDINEALFAELSDFEDAVVDAVAARIGANYILTRNIKDFYGSNIRAVTPTEYLSL